MNCRTGAGVLLATASSLIFAPMALAQSAPPQGGGEQSEVGVEAAPEAAESSSEAGPADEILVTGSRLQNAGFAAPTPMTSLSTEQILRTAPAAISDIISELPSFRATQGPNQNQRNKLGTGSGQSQIDLRGLGASRTLVLVNGRRFVGQNTSGNVDTAVIPVGLIDRIEVVTGGASAAYGSDAVAGVANFILNDRLEGFSASAQVGISQYGDNAEHGFSASWGGSFAGGRGHIVVGADYNRNDGVGTIYERDVTSLEPGNTANPIPFTGANRLAGTPAQGFLTRVQYSGMTKGSVINAARTATGQVSTILNQTAFNPDGSTYKLVRGTVYGSLMAGTMSNYGAGPIANWNLKTPNRRTALMAMARYELEDDLEAFVDANFATTNVSGYTSFHTQALTTILVDNPFLPAEIRNTMVANNLTQIDIGRVDTDWGGARSDNDLQAYRIAAGFKGKLSESWSWDAYFQHGRTDAQPQIYHTRESNLLAAEYVVTGPNGQPMCGPLATNPNFAPNRRSALIDPSKVQSGCVPFNPFGSGKNSQAAIDYVSGWEYTDIKIRQNVAAFNLSGTLFELPAGPVSIATGLEWRRDELSQTVDPLQLLSLYGSGNNKPYSGSQTVAEGYLEIGVPLMKDGFLGHALDLNGAIRQTHYSNSGWVTTWKGGLSYEPVDGLRFRATQSRDIRAPNLTELFFVGGTTASASQDRNPFNNLLGRLAITGTGNPNLKPETADTFTAGVVIQPTWSWLSGLRASIDYYSINVTDVIAAVPATDVLQRCFEGNKDYCAQIEFDNTVYGIRNVNNAPFNQAQLKTSGIDFELAYSSSLETLGLPGRVELRALAGWVDHLIRRDRAGPGGVAVDYAGSSTQGVPEWTGNISLNYRVGAFTVGGQARLFSSFLYDPRFIGPDDKDYDPALPNSINYNRFPSITYFGLNMSFDTEVDDHKMQFFATVNNLFNTDPPELAIAALNSGGNPYDFVGRTFKVGTRVQW